MTRTLGALLLLLIPAAAGAQVTNYFAIAYPARVARLVPGAGHMVNLDARDASTRR